MRASEDGRSACGEHLFKYLPARNGVFCGLVLAFGALPFLNACMAVYISVSNRSQHAWGKTGGAGGMRLVTPLHPEGPEGPAKQEAGVGVSARLQSTMLVAAGPLSLPPFAPLLEHPAGRQQEG